MNKIARMIMKEHMHDSGRDAEQDDHRRSRLRESYDSGYRDGYDQANYEIHGEYDGARRRSKTTGRYMRDRGEYMHLPADSIAHWERKLQNADSTQGPHFNTHQVQEVANRLGIRFDEYTEQEFCMAMNMLYSDLCEVCRMYVSPDKEAAFYGKLAQAWLEDKDGPSPSEKLALYFYCIADDDE